jgi:hypothetical protein
MRNRYVIPFILAVILFSCSKEKKEVVDIESLLEGIEAFYCTPNDPSRCLPLTISNKYTGSWCAYYQGAKDAIELEYRVVGIDEYDYLEVAFDEYIDGKRNGSYIFNTYYPWCFDREITCKYVNTQGEEVMNFNVLTINEEKCVIDTDDIANSLNILLSVNDVWIDNNADRGVENLAVLLHKNPNVIDYPINDSRLKVVSSADGNLRIYVLDSWVSGSARNVYYSFVQYKSGDSVFTLDLFDCLLGKRIYDTDEYYFLPFPTYRIFQTTINKETCYLLEVSFPYDRMNLNFTEDNVLIIETCALFAYTIKNGKLIPKNILNGESHIVCVLPDDEDAYDNKYEEDFHFNFDGKTKKLDIPVIEEKTHKFEGNYRTIFIR